MSTKSAEEAVRDTSPCLDPNWMSAYLERSLTRNQRDLYQVHVASCSSCRDALALCARAAVSAPRKAERVSRWPLSSPWMVATAATLVGIAVLIGWRLGAPLPLPVRGDAEVLRSGRGSSMVPSLTIAGKTFTLAAGVWVDESIEQGTLLQTIEVRRGSDYFSQLLRAHPRLREWSEAGPVVRVQVEDTIYEIGGLKPES